MEPSQETQHASQEPLDTRECRQCGEEIAADVRFCPRCGHKVLPQEGMAVYEYVPVMAFTECPRCGHEHEEQVLRCSRCGIAVDVELMHSIAAGQEARLRPLFDWNRGIRQGLLGYAIFQGIMIALSGLPDLAVQWPTYVVFAVLWTVVSALQVETGPIYGVMLGMIGLNYVLGGWLGPITDAWGVLRLHLVTLFVMVLGLTLVGLVRGRLEFLRLWDRTAVSRLFGLAAMLLISAYLIGDLAGPRFSRGEVRFETAAVVARERWDLKSTRTIFQKGDPVGWVAELKRATRSRVVQVEIARVQDGRESLLGRANRSLKQAGTVRILETIETRDLEPGWYLVRIREADEVLAEGRFLLQVKAY